MSAFILKAPIFPCCYVALLSLSLFEGKEKKASSVPIFFSKHKIRPRWTDYHSAAIYSPPAPGLHSGPVFSVLPAKLIIFCHSPAAAQIRTPVLKLCCKNDQGEKKCFSHPSVCRWWEKNKKKAHKADVSPSVVATDEMNLRCCCCSCC